MFQVLGRRTARLAAPTRRFTARAAVVAAPQVSRADAGALALVAAGAGFAALALTLKGDKSLKDRVASLEIAAAEKTSSAFVFIKPHAVTDEAKDLVRKGLAAAGISIVSEGVIPAEVIDKEKLIDQHYGAIAAKAVSQKPASLTVQPKAQEQFQKTFGLSWSDALSQGKVFNAVDACAKKGWSFDQLGTKWGTLKKDVTLIKFGGGFYCGKVDDMFVINGFYMDMRKAFTIPGTCIYYFETQWDSSVLSWEDFRGKTLGGTDPAKAAAGSLRNTIFKQWQDLKLKSVPNTGDNGVHASASPFEALAERSNWLGASLSEDPFGRAMLACGVPLKFVKSWTNDPPVMFEGKKQSIFDLLEDMDGRDCLKKAAAIAKQN